MATNKTHSNKLIYPELSYIVTGILFSAHNELGQFCREKQYGDLVEKKFKEIDLKYKREYSVSDSGNIIDFIIDDKIILELKSSRVITRDNYRQIQNYLQQTGMNLGILVNFRSKYLQPIRVIRLGS